jgi:hypothetical protein
MAAAEHPYASLESDEVIVLQICPPDLTYAPDR